MKIFHTFFTLVLFFGMATSMYAMDYKHAKKGKLRNSQEKIKSNKHIPRKKSKKRKLRSSKEEHKQNFLFGTEHDIIESVKQKPLTHSDGETKRPKARRSRSFSITVPGRRSSTGQINVTKKEPETQTNYSPRLKRENSRGSIELTPEKWLILETLRKKQDDAKEQLEKEKLEQD